MKWFGRTGGYYMFWTGFVYFCLGLVDVFVYRFTEVEYLQVCWIVVLALPLTIRPIARYFNTRLLWEL